MELYDLLMISVVVLMTLYGSWKGMAWQVASLSAVFVSYMVAYRFRVPVSEMISTGYPWNIFLAMLILYIGCSLAIWLLFRLVSHLIDRVKLTEFDSQIGALFGCFNGVLVCVIATLFSITLLGDQTRESIVGSRSGYYIAILLDRSHALMPEEIHQVLHPFIDQLDGDVHQEPRFVPDLNTSAGGTDESPPPGDVRTADGSEADEATR
ncbi:MAG: CvpA family protein [Pirellulaceae bacterium]|nr:CvpA family protein [Pirellulaceae bacterium]